MKNSKIQSVKNPVDSRYNVCNYNSVVKQINQISLEEFKQKYPMLANEFEQIVQKTYEHVKDTLTDADRKFLFESWMYFETHIKEDNFELWLPFVYNTANNQMLNTPDYNKFTKEIQNDIATKQDLYVDNVLNQQTLNELNFSCNMFVSGSVGVCNNLSRNN